tara:strand:+ start:474 stop:1250 length:777 start_codon:yes stop_codon:yes gene_type:complete
MRVSPLFVVFIFVLLSSCRGTKTITDVSRLSVNEIISSHNAAAPNFKTLAGRFQVAYEDNKKKQSITASLRIEKDKIIWIKASILGITLAKVLITPDRVSYYESISNTYFEGDFALLSDLLGTEIDFKKAQDILLGQSIFNLNSTKYKSEIVLDKVKLQPKRQAQNFIHSILLNTKNFKVSTETLSQPDDKRNLDVRYEDYRLIEGGFYPSVIEINASAKDSKTKIGLKFRKIDLNVDISFPFKIPKGYEEIQFKIDE